MNFRSLFLTGLALFVFFGIGLPAIAEIQTMTVSEIRPGMVGVGRTVIRGTEIEEFRCEVIDVFQSMGYNGEALIFVRISGDVVDATGGIAGGYSGSPVYIDGKLIGALSWGPYFTEGDVAGVTPINEMMKAFTYPDEEPHRISSAPECLPEPIEVAGRTFDSIALADFNEGRMVENIFGSDTLVLTPCKTPLVVSGLSQAGIDILRQFGEERMPYIDIVAGPGGGSEGVPILLGPTVLEPGASIGAQLASGDLDLTAVGTLTWIDDSGRFLAFGHPFLMDGPTDLPFLTTKIVYTMPALDRSYKLGEPLEIVGTITQDRLTCIAGQLRQAPEMVDFTLKVIDNDLGHTRNYNYSVVNKETWLPILGWVMPLEGISYAMDREGETTCRVNFSIRGEGLAEPIERENLIYSSYGASGALYEFYEALNMLTAGNSFREVRITNVDIEVEITSVNQSLNITRARFQNPPNMGPGAVGYEGPDSLDEKENKDDLVNQQTDWMDSAELQGIPPETMDAMMDPGMMMNTDMMGLGMTNMVKYKPGDTIEVLVTLRPWREDPVEQVIEIRIPDDFPVGITTLEVYGGISNFYGGGMYYYMDTTGMGYYGTDYYFPPESLEEVIQKFNERDVNNALIVRLIRPVITDDPYYYLRDNYEPPKETRALVTMGDVIMGYYSLPIEISTGTMDEAAYPTDMAETCPPPPVIEQEPAPRGGNPYRN